MASSRKPALSLLRGAIQNIGGDTINARRVDLLVGLHVEVFEVAAADEFDVTLVNDDLKVALDLLRSLLFPTPVAP